VRPSRRARAASALVIASLSAWTATGRSSAAARCIPSYRVRSSARGNSGTPETDMKALKPTTPRSASSSRRSALPGTRPPHSAKSTSAAPSAAARLASNATASVVGGSAFSGMSTAVVVPPAASARVPVSKPSHAVRPGSLRWTWASTTPGRTCRPVASISSRADSSSAGATAAMRPSATPTSARRAPSGATSVPPRTARSSALIPSAPGGRRGGPRHRARPRRPRPRPPRPGCG
jgi:hypothetical protein